MLSDLHESFADQNSRAFMRKIDTSQEDRKELEGLAMKRDSSVIWDMIESLESQKRCLGTEQTEKTDRTPAHRDGRRRETMKCFRQGQEIVFVPQTAVSRGKPKQSIVQEHLETQYMYGNGSPVNEYKEDDNRFESLKVSKMAKFVGLITRIRNMIAKLTKNARIWDKITRKELACISDLAAAEDQDVSSQEGNSVKVFRNQQTYGKSSSNVRRYFIANLYSWFPLVPIFVPFSGGKIIWDLVVLIAIVTVSFLFSLRVFFLLSFQQFNQTFFSAFLILSFDMIIQFNTAFLDKGSLINTRRLIILQYLKNDALLDLISLIPLIFVEPTFHIQEQFEVASLSLFICKWPQLKKIWQRFHFFLSYQRNQKNLADLLQLIFQIVSVCHIFCLFWHGLAIFEISLGKSNTWLNSYNLLDSDIFKRYIVSFYYLSTTMITVGYGDITPKNTVEISFTVITMFVTGTIWAFFLTSIASIFANIQRKDKKYNENMQVIHSLMREENVNASLRLKISNYLEYLYKESNEAVRNRENDIISKLSNQLRTDIIQDIRGKYLEEIPIMAKLKEKARLAQVMEECLFSPGECVFKEAQEDDFSLFYLIKGKVELTFSTKNIHREDTVITTLERKSYFGEISFITGQPRTLTARAKDFCRVYKFQRSKFLDVIANNPHDLENIAMMREEISMNGDFKLCNASCLLCSKDNHLAHECPRSHLKKSMFGIAQRINYSVPRPERLAFQRKGFKFPTRKCLQDILDGVLDINNDEDLYDVLDELERNLACNYTEDLEKDFDDDLEDDDEDEEKKESVAQPENDSFRPRQNLTNFSSKYNNKPNGIIPEQLSPLNLQKKITLKCKNSLYSQQSLLQEAQKKDNPAISPQIKKTNEDHPQNNLLDQNQSHGSSTVQTISSKTSKKQTSSQHSSSMSSSSLDSSQSSKQSSSSNSSSSSSSSSASSSASSSSSRSQVTSSFIPIPEKNKNQTEISQTLEYSKAIEEPCEDNQPRNQDYTVLKGIQPISTQNEDGIPNTVAQIEENSKEEQPQAKPILEKIKLQSQPKRESKEINKLQHNGLHRYVSLGANNTESQLKLVIEHPNLLPSVLIDQQIEPKRSKQMSMNSFSEINGIQLHDLKNNNNDSKQCPPLPQSFGIQTRRQSQNNGERIRGITAHKPINPISLQEQIQVILDGIKQASNNLFSRMSQDRKDSKQLSQKYEKGARHSQKSMQLEPNGPTAERRIRNQQEMFSTNQFREFNSQVEAPGEVNYKMLLSFDLYKVFRYYFPSYNYPQVIERWQQSYLIRYELYLKKKKAAKKLKYRTEKSKRLLDNSLLNS